MEVFVKFFLAVFLSTIPIIASKLGIEKRLLVIISILNIVIILAISHVSGGVDFLSFIIISAMSAFHGYMLWREVASPIERIRKILSGVTQKPQPEILKLVSEVQAEGIKTPEFKTIFSAMRNISTLLRGEQERIDKMKKIFIDLADFIRYLTTESDKLKVISEVRNFLGYVIPSVRVLSVIQKRSGSDELIEGKSYTVDGKEFIVIGGDVAITFLRNIVTQGKFEDDVLGYVSYPLTFDEGLNAYLIIEGENIQSEYRLLSYLVAKFMEAVLSRISREQKIQIAAVTDPLTGVYNRRYFIERLQQSFSKYKRVGESYVVVIFDIDRFKRINDIYGHFVGDEVLKAFGYLLREWVRRYDVAARFGGDEFVLFLDNIKKEDAVNVAKRISNKFEQFSPVKGIVGMKVSVSWGLASVDEASDSFEDVIKLADKRLLKAKGVEGGQGIWE